MNQNGKHVRIYQYDKQERKAVATTPKKVAWEDNFYTLTDADALKMENGLKGVEGKASSVIKHIINTESLQGLSVSDLASLLTFVALQTVRTSQFRNITVGCQQLPFQALGGLQFLPNAKDTPPKDIPKDKQNVTYHAKSILSGFEFVLESLEHMKRTVLVNDTSIPFWTSDNPVVRYNNIYGGSRPDTIGSQITLPLSPRIMLAFYDPTYDRLVRSASNGRYTYGGVMHTVVREDVIDYNQLQFKFATRFVYSSRSLFPYMKGFHESEKMDCGEDTKQWDGDGWATKSAPTSGVVVDESNLRNVVYGYNIAKSVSDSREKFERLHDLLFPAANVITYGDQGKELDELVKKLIREPNAPMGRWRCLREQMKSDEELVPSMEDVCGLEVVIAKLIFYWMSVKGGLQPLIMPDCR